MTVRHTISAFSKKIRLRTILTLFIILFVGGSSTLVIYLSLNSSKAAVNNLANSLMKQTSTQINNQLDSYLQIHQQILKPNRLLIENKKINPNDIEQLKSHFWWQINMFPHIESILWASDKGELFSYRRDISGSRSPKGTITWVELKVSDLGKRSTWAIDANGNPVSRILEVDWDPRERPWYRETKMDPRQQWSSVSAVKVYKHLALLATTPVFNAEKKFQGLFASAIFLIDLNDFISKINLSAFGNIFIVERSGKLIASSAPEKLYLKKENQVNRVNATDSENFQVRSISEKLVNDYGGFESKSVEGMQTSYLIDGKPVFVQTTSYKDDYGLDWIVVAAMPESYFMGEISANTYRTIFICGLFLICTMILGNIIARKMTHPIEQLNSKAKKINRNYFEETHIATPIKETSELSKSFNEMTNRLKLSFDDMQILNDKLTKAEQVLSDNNKQLEKQVLERTQELERQNRQLAIEQQNAEKANKTTNKFLSIISHDLKGPIGSLALIFNEALSSPSQIDDRLFNIFKKNTQSVYNLLEDLLTWSRQQQEKIEVQKTTFSVNHLVESCLFLTKGQADQKNIRITWEPGKSELIYADPSMIKTVLRNLLGNALKFTPKGGEIRIETCDMGGALELSITDSGVGIPSYFLKKLFRIDEKIKPTPGTDQETGSGMGLILCREFVTKNQGQINVESKPSKGSRFWFTLPKPTPDNIAPLNDINTLYENHAAFLLVEDNPLHVRAGAYVLEHLGATVEVAEDGEEAVNMARKKPFDVILMAIDLPKRNGVEAMKFIRKDSSFQGLILALTAYSHEEVNQKFGPAEFDGYLNKPLSPEKLMELLKKLAVGSRQKRIKKIGHALDSHIF